MTAWHKKYKAIFAEMPVSKLLEEAQDYNGSVDGHLYIELILNELEVRFKKEKESIHETSDHRDNLAPDSSAVRSGGS